MLYIHSWKHYREKSVLKPRFYFQEINIFNCLIYNFVTTSICTGFYFVKQMSMCQVDVFLDLWLKLFGKVFV